MGTSHQKIITTFKINKSIAKAITHIKQQAPKNIKTSANH